MKKEENEGTVSRNNKMVEGFIKQYSKNQRPIDVSFRELFPEIRSIDRYTHLIHTYPAKLLVHIPYFFLNNTYFSNEGDTVLDPFSGSGTVLLEGIIANRNAYGADANPLARLIASVKTSKLDTNRLDKILQQVLKRAYKYKKGIKPEVVNCDYWFSGKTIQSLSKILASINKVKDQDSKNFMLVAFSNCVKKVSYADPRISVPVKLNSGRYRNGSTRKAKIEDRLKALKSLDVFERFESIAKDNIARFQRLRSLNGSVSTARIISSDARTLTQKLGDSRKLRSNCVQLIITSPPYAGAQKYIRASSLNLGWTQLAKPSELAGLDKKNIGRENYRQSEISISHTGIKGADKLIEHIYAINPSRAKIVCQYIHEMKDALNEMIRVLKKGGFLVLIVGNNKVCNKEFNTQEYLTEFITGKGLKLQFKLIDDIKSYGLMTKRNKTADIISREWILVFKK